MSENGPSFKEKEIVTAENKSFKEKAVNTAQKVLKVSKNVLDKMGEANPTSRDFSRIDQRLDRDGNPIGPDRTNMVDLEMARKIKKGEEIKIVE